MLEENGLKIHKKDLDKFLYVDPEVFRILVKNCSKRLSNEEIAKYQKKFDDYKKHLESKTPMGW